MQKVQEAFEKVAKNLNKYSLKTREKILERLESARGKHTIGQVFHYQLSQHKGRFRLPWHIDETALARAQQPEGAYVIKTDLPKGEYPAAKVFEQYKVEKMNPAGESTGLDGRWTSIEKNGPRFALDDLPLAEMPGSCGHASPADCPSQRPSSSTAFRMLDALISGG